ATENPWRASYARAAYRRARQIALARTEGRCAVSGEVIAVYRDGEWRMLPSKGGVHHIVPLSAGGDDSPENLVALSVAAHNKIEAEERRRRYER
ncbi:HNH endonuclease, partial [Collinsella sp. AGMB00827]